MDDDEMALMSDGEFSLKLLAALPADPFEQLEVAQRITSRAVAAGVTKLETETGRLRQKLGEKDATILSMQHRMLDLERTLEDTSSRLSQALDSEEKVTSEKNMLITAVQKMKKEICKLMIAAAQFSQDRIYMGPCYPRQLQTLQQLFYMTIVAILLQVKCP